MAKAGVVHAASKQAPNPHDEAVNRITERMHFKEQLARYFTPKGAR